MVMLGSVAGCGSPKEVGLFVSERADNTWAAGAINSLQRPVEDESPLSITVYSLLLKSTFSWKWYDWCISLSLDYLMPAVLWVGSCAGKTKSWLVMLAEALRAGKASYTKKRSVPIWIIHRSFKGGRGLTIGKLPSNGQMISLRNGAMIWALLVFVACRLDIYKWQ